MEEFRNVAATARLKDLGLVRQWVTRVTHLIELVTSARDEAERQSIERHFAIAQGRKREATKLLMGLQRNEAQANLIAASVQSWLGVTSMEEAFERVALVRLHLLHSYELYEAWVALRVQQGTNTAPEWADAVASAAANFNVQSMATIRVLPDSMEVVTL